MTAIELTEKNLHAKALISNNTLTSDFQNHNFKTIKKYFVSGFPMVTGKLMWKLVNWLPYSIPLGIVYILLKYMNAEK